MNYQSILYEKSRGIATITLNRPEKLNAMNQGAHGIVREFVRAAGEAESDPEVRVVIVKGAGRCFCSGYDISGEAATTGKHWEKTPLVERTSNDWMDLEMDTRQWWIDAIWNNPKPFIAQVHSFCLAGGMDLAATCDITICSDDAVFGYPAVRYGSIPTTPVWAYLVGFKKAKEIVLTGNMYTAKEMHDFHLVNKVVPRDKLDEEVRTLASEMTKMPEVGQKINKMWVNELFDIAGCRSALAFTNALGGIVHTSRDAVGREFFKIVVEKGLKAALEFRDAKFAEVDVAGRELRQRRLDKTKPK